MSVHFPKLRKKLTKDVFNTLLHKLTKAELLNFDIEKLWNEGNIQDIKAFLKDGVVHKNKLANCTLQYSSNPAYLDTIKTWIENQMDVLKELNEVETLSISRPEVKKGDKKIPAKYYGLYQRMLVELKQESDFRKDDNDLYCKAEIMKFGQGRYKTNGQGFYYGYKDVDLSNKIAIVRSYKNMKEIISNIANNNAEILHYLKEFPD